MARPKLTRLPTESPSPDWPRIAHLRRRCHAGETLTLAESWECIDAFRYDREWYEAMEMGERE